VVAIKCGPRYQHHIHGPKRLQHRDQMAEEAEAGEFLSALTPCHDATLILPASAYHTVLPIRSAAFYSPRLPSRLQSCRRKSRSWSTPSWPRPWICWGPLHPPLSPSPWYVHRIPYHNIHVARIISCSISHVISPHHAGGPAAATAGDPAAATAGDPAAARANTTVWNVVAGKHHYLKR
jgi:hypothetical protein